jgi:hypothetical protein
MTPGSVCALYARGCFISRKLSKVTDISGLYFSRLSVSFASIPNRDGWLQELEK